MEKKSKRQAQLAAASILVLVSVILALIFQFIHRTNTRITEQNQRYLEDASVQSLRTIDELFKNSVSSISMISGLYQQLMDTAEFDYNELNILRDQTAFDYMRFVDVDGISHAGDGTVQDVSDRSYYKDGITGNEGITFVQQSRFTSARMLVFYAPFYHRGQIVGVLVGVFDEEHLRELMSATYFGKTAVEYLCLRDGTVVACGEENSPENILKDFEERHVLSEEKMKEFRHAFTAGESYSYTYKDKAGTGNGCVAVLKDSNWIMVKTFPATAGRQMQLDANRDAIHLEIKLIIVFAVYIILFSLYYISKNGRLRRSSENYSQIVDSVKQLYDRFVVFDFENSTYDYLKEGSVTLGVPKTGDYYEWLNAFPSAHFSEEDASRFLDEFSPENLRNSLNLENRFIRYEYELAEKGKWEKYSLIKLNMDGDDTRRVLAAVEDVSSLKKEEMEKRNALEQAFRDAENANNAKMDFLSRMSHDIRTPMNAIIGLTAIAGTHMDDRERISDCLAKITTAGRHLLSLINEVLDMSKIESGKFSLSETEFNLSDLLDDVLEMIRPSLNDKKQNFTVKVENIEHEDVIGDSLRVRQIFVNILSNAVKYTGNGGDITLTITEKPNPHSRLGCYEFVFEDNGIGMSEDFLKRLFVPFERAEDVRTSKIQGTGLGMAIVRNIVRAMDGTIKVKSSPGKGSQFTVVISLKLQEVEHNEEQRLSGLLVLAADADTASCESTCMALNELGIKGSCVTNGKEAVDAVCAAHDRKQGYYAVIIDRNMQDMDGIQMVKEIRKKTGPDTPVIFMTAFDWSDIEDEARAAGVDEFISKPLFKTKLRSALIHMLPEENGQEEKSQLEIMGGIDLSGKRALLVEDNEINMEIAAEILGMTGLSLEKAENGKRGVELFSESEEGWYSIIFMDIQMPVMNGYEAAAAIRALPRSDAKTIPVVAMTANAFSEDVQDALGAGMNEHISKPLEIDRLVQILQKWL